MDLSHLTDEQLESIVKSNAQQEISSKNDIVNNEEEGLLSKLGHGYSNYAKGAFRGMGQAAGDIGASIGNLGISGAEKLFGTKIPHIPHPDLLNKNPASLSESIGQNLGEIVTPFILPGGGAYKAAKLGKGLIQKTLIGSGIGSALGAAENEENRGLGALAGLLGGAAGAGIPAINSIRSKNIAKQLSEAKEGVVNKFKGLYENLFGDAKQNTIRKPDIKSDKIIKHSTSDYNTGLKEFLINPTLENAQNAQSDMGKLISHLTQSNKSKPLTSQKIKALEYAKDAQKRLRGSIATELEKISPGKAKKYGEITEGYKKEVIPFTRQKSLTEFEEGKLEPKDLISSLLKDKKFMAQVSKNHPELRYRKNLNALKNNKLATGAAIGTGATLLPYEISKLLGMK